MIQNLKQIVKADLDDMIFGYNYCAQLAYVMAFERPHTHNFHIQHAHVSYECHVLIYTKRSVVKS